MNSPKLKIVLLLILATIVLGCRFFLVTPSAGGDFIAHWGYWIMFIGVAAYLFQLWRFIRLKSPSTFFGRYRIGLLVALLGTFFLEVNEPRQFKVLLDEFVISSVARNMHFSREATFSDRAHNVNDRLEIFDAHIDKRPFFFQFTLSCLHDITGYRPQNVFVLNGIATFLLLFSAYYFGVQYGGWRLGIACVGLWLALPLLAQCATSGGYDVFNLLMLFLVWYFGREYLRTGNAVSQNVLVLTTLHLAQVRYESILFVVPVSAIILIRWVRQREIQIGWVAVVAPLFLFLPLLINFVFTHTPGSFQTDPGQSFFGLGYLLENTGRAVWYLFNPSLSATNSFWFSAIGLVSAVAFVVRVMSLRKDFLENDDNKVVALIGLFILGNTVLVLCNFWGQWDDPAASRFSLPLHLLFVCCFASMATEFARKRPISTWVPVSIMTVAFAFSVPAAAQNCATRMLWQGREYTWFLEQLDKPTHRGALVISQTLGPILYDHPAIDIQVAEVNKWKVSECLRNSVYPEIVVLERFVVDYQTLEERPYNEDKSLDYKTSVTSPEGITALSSSFKKEKIAEIRLRANVVSRISRIVAVEGPDAIPPKAYLDEVPPFENAGAYLRHVYSSLP